MLQRIQTIYLLIALVISILIFFLPVSAFFMKDHTYLLFHNGLRAAEGNNMPEYSSLPVTILLWVITLLNSLIIFLYKNRLRQIRIILYNIIFLCGLEGLIVYYFYIFKATTVADTQFYLPILFPLLAIILNLLAIKSIRKDENIIRAADRIR